MSIKDLFIPKTVYVKILPDRFELRQIDTGRDLKYSADEPFSDSKNLIVNFEQAEKTLKLAVKKITEKHVALIRPRAVIHPLKRIPARLDEKQTRMFRELAIAAGFYKAYVWTGQPLNDEKVLEIIKR